MNFFEKLRYLFTTDFLFKINQLTEEHEQLKGEHEQLTGEHEQLKGEHKQLTAAHEEESAAIENLSCDVRQLKEENKSLKMLCASLNASCKSLNERCDALEAKCMDLTAALEAAAAQNRNGQAAGYELIEAEIQKLTEIINRNLRPEISPADYNNMKAQIEGLLIRVTELERPGREAELPKAELKKEELSKSELPKAEPSNAEKPVRDNPFFITENRDRYSVTGDNLEHVLTGICNTAMVDDFFMDIPNDNKYKKLFERYKKSIRKCADRAGQEDDMEDALNLISSVVQDDLLKRIVLAIYRGMKSGRLDFETELLQRLNKYLQKNGFYTRDDIRVGQIMADKDFDDMEPIRDDRAGGGGHGEITEIELYPYYLNYIDETGKKESVHTQGQMIVIA